MKKFMKLWRNFKSFLKRLRKPNIEEIRYLVRLNMTAETPSEKLMTFTEMEQFSQFYQKHQETLAVVLNKLTLEYNDSAKAFYKVFAQCHSDSLYLHKKKLNKEKSNRLTKKV